MADGKDGKYMTRILSMKGYKHTGGKPDDEMWWVLGTNALLAAVQDVCAEWMKAPNIPSVAKLKVSLKVRLFRTRYLDNRSSVEWE